MPPTEYSENQKQNPGGNIALSRAFSLVELLIVIGIIGLLAAFAVPAINSMGQARGVTEAAFQVASAVELARSEAMARNTFVWLGLRNETNFGSTDLRIGLASSKDGSSTNLVDSNLLPIGRPLLVKSTGLVPVSDLQLGTTNVPPYTADLSSNSTPKLRLGNVQFQNSVVLFTPEGETLLEVRAQPDSPFETLIGVGLKAFRGTTPMQNNDVAVLVDGSTSVARILQRQ